MGAVAELIEALESEHAALLAEDAQALELAIRRKQILLDAISRAPAPASRGAAGELRRARKLNERNAQVLAPRMQVQAARLQALCAVTGRAPLYGASGGLAGGIK